MAYPKNDDDYAEGVVTKVCTAGKNDELIAVWHRMDSGTVMGKPYDGFTYLPKPQFEVKRGMRIRVYGYNGIWEHGAYIAGRVVVPYKTKKQADSDMAELLGKSTEHFMQMILNH